MEDIKLCCGVLYIVYFGHVKTAFCYFLNETKARIYKMNRNKKVNSKRCLKKCYMGKASRQMDKITSIGRFESKTPRVKKRLYEKCNIHTFCIYDWI